jgi:cell division protein FtsW
VRGPAPYDRWLLLATLGLMAVGVVFVYSASAVSAAQTHGDARHYLDRQMFFAAAALLLLAVGARIRPETLYRHALPLYVLALVLLALVLVPGIGHKVGGARRWLAFEEMRLQPSELARIALLVLLARFLCVRLRRGEEGSARLTTLPALFLAAVPAALVLLEPDLDTAVLFGAVSFLLLFLSGVPLRQLGKLTAVLLLCLAVLLASAGYRRSRMLAFLYPEADPLGSGYQVRQSLLAVGLGGITGVGVGESRQKLFYLPAAHTDFIFAVLTEETGLAGGLAVLSLIGLLLWRGMRIAGRQPDPFSFLLAAGLTGAFGLSAFINLGAVLSLLPATGICLPLVSYGGSSLLSQALSIGLLLSLSRQASGGAQPPSARRAAAPQRS